MEDCFLSENQSKQPTNTFLSKNIKFLRQQSALTQTALAEAVGVSRHNISSYEYGQVEPKLECLAKLSQFFGTSVENLVKKDLQKLSQSSEL